MVDINDSIIELKPMTIEESYIERRQLFKNIWNTAMTSHENEDILNKSKVIKTLRMDELEKCPIGKSKKQRIKNLRHVCHRILEFCDKNEVDEHEAKRKLRAKRHSISPHSTTRKLIGTKLRVKRQGRTIINTPIYTVGNSLASSYPFKLQSTIDESGSHKEPSSQLRNRPIKRKLRISKTKPKREEKNVLFDLYDYPIEGTSTKRKIHKKGKAHVKKKAVSSNKISS